MRCSLIDAVRTLAAVLRNISSFPTQTTDPLRPLGIEGNVVVTMLLGSSWVWEYFLGSLETLCSLYGNAIHPSSDGPAASISAGEFFVGLSRDPQVCRVLFRIVSRVSVELPEKKGQRTAMSLDFRAVQRHANFQPLSTSTISYDLSALFLAQIVRGGAAPRIVTALSKYMNKTYKV